MNVQGTLETKQWKKVFSETTARGIMAVHPATPDAKPDSDTLLVKRRRAGGKGGFGTACASTSVLKAG